MTFAEKLDYGLIPVIDVARALFGAGVPDGRDEVRFPDRGGLLVNIKKNRWYCHVETKGGDAIALIQFDTGCDFKGALDWLRSHGFEKYLGERAPKKVTHLRTAVAHYNYVDANGELLYQVIRYDPKEFKQRRPDGKGDWIWKGVEKGKEVPYRLPELLASNKNIGVLIPAGEKDVDNLYALGLTATCNHGGEGIGKWWRALTPYFKGRRVFILVDNDEAGEHHQNEVGAALTGVASEIRVVRFSELPPKSDVSDLIERLRKQGLDDDGVKRALYERFKAAPVWGPTEVVTAETNTATIIATTNEEWPEPVSLPEGLSPVEPLDTALLPAALAPWVIDISERMQCPPDYIAAAALTGLGAVLGRKIGVAPEQQTDWFEVPNNWCCIVGRPGDLKSPAIGEALKPLHRLEVDARKTFDADLEAYAKDLQLWKLRKDAAEARAKRDLRTNPHATIQFDVPEPPEPTERRYVTNDTTYEKLGEILAENPNGVLAHRDELVSLLKTLDREEFAAARGFFLTAWNGKDRYTFDRIMRGKTHVEAACVSLLGSTQPGRLAEYVRRAVSGGAADDGLIQRFGLLVWPDQSPAWENIDRYPNSEARNAAWECFAGFDSLDPGAIGAEPTSQFQSVPVLRLDGEAHELFLEWRKELERSLRSGDLHPALASHLAKYRKLVPTLALITHLADRGHGLIGKDAMMRSLGLATYLETHAKRAYGAGPEAETAAAKAILTHIRKGNLTDGFSARDVHQRGWSNLSDRGQVQAGLDLLCDLDWIVAVEKRSPDGGRPTTHYHLNPRALQ